ncbi:MAG: glycosidase [Candidatus Eremiobacteraeota bacterium]|nr:glycosidase [Candidatus Eremiobacteraeota bacterium]
MLDPKIEPKTESFDDVRVEVERLGLVLEPNGDPEEAGGILNPAGARAPGGEWLLYPRCVAEGNISRVGIVRTKALDKGFEVERLGYALVPEAEYELRPHPGYGCEDPRVTYVPVLESYVMAYTAFGPQGPRIAIALSKDAYRWERLGIVTFDGAGVTIGDDKDAAFFPEPVLSPNGVRSLAFYHRPMLHLSAVDGRAAIPMIERMPFEDRESIRIAYVPLDDVLRDRAYLLRVKESVRVLSPDARWGSIKIGAGTVPVRVPEGWMSIFHGVDLIDNQGSKPSLRYSAGIVVHDLQRPDRVLYRSPEPIMVPLHRHECEGVVNNVVFPTALDERADIGEGVYDVYYGMGDARIGAARMCLSATS